MKYEGITTIKNWWNQKSDAMAWFYSEGRFTNGEVIMSFLGTLFLMLLISMAGTLDSINL